MKLLIFALFVASVSAGSFKVGNVKCTFGPSYWCQNYKQAKECDAVQHCQEKVWKVKVKSNETCTICQDAMVALKAVFANPDIQKQITGLLEGLCTNAGSLAAECKALIDQYAPLIFQEITQLLANPKQICTELHLCSASKEKIMAALLEKALPNKLKAFAPKFGKQILKASKPVKASPQCILCEFIASKLDQMLGNNATQQEIEAALDKVCSLLPSTIRSECDAFIKEYAPEILQILAQELNPKMVCTALGLCSSNKFAKSIKKKYGNGEFCEWCTTIMFFAKNYLQNNKTDQEIIDELKGLCGRLPSQIASECSAIVSEYGLVVLKMIANADPKTLCTEIGLCTSKTTKLFKIIAKKSNCELGASYWCANQANAVKCNAVSFCTKHAW